MGKKGNLFFLIKSLSKAEKRYFKLSTISQKSSNNYQRLFDAIDAQEAFDERALKEQFAGEAFARQLHVTKNYLKQLLLRSLRNYHHKSSHNGMLKASLHHIELLFQRELFSQCHYEIQKAECIARNYEYYPALLETLQWKRKLLIAQKGFPQEELLALSQEEADALAALQRINQLQALTAGILRFRNDEAGVFWQQEPLKNPPPEKELSAHILYAHVQYTYLTINGQPEKGIQLLQELTLRLEAHPERIREAPSAYLTVLSNLVSAHIFQKDYPPVPPLLDKIKTTPQRFGMPEDSQYTIKLRLRTYNIELEMYRDTKAWKQGNILVEETAHYLQKHQRAIPPHYCLQLWYQFAYLYFMNRRYGEALQWANKILQTPHKQERIDLQVYARFLNLMAHFEMDNTFVLKYAVDSTRRFLRKQEREEGFEPVLLRFFSRLCNSPKTEYKALFQYLYDDLFKASPPLVSVNVLDYLDFRYWIERYIQSK